MIPSFMIYLVILKARINPKKPAGKKKRIAVFTFRTVGIKNHRELLNCADSRPAVYRWGNRRNQFSFHLKFIDVASVQITREKCPRMRDKIGCRDDVDRNLQNFSESFGNSNIVKNTNQRVINRVVHSLFL